MEERIYTICDTYFFLQHRVVGLYSIKVEPNPQKGFLVVIHVENPASLLDEGGKGVRRLANCLSILLDTPVNIRVDYERRK
jgi:ribosomal protein S3